MVAFVAGAVLTAANLNTSLNQLTIRTVTGTSDTLLLADQGGAVSYSNAASTTSTIPPNSSVAYAVGTKIVLINLGAGVVTVTAGVGVTINGSPLTLAQNAGGTCIKTATNTWSFLPFSSGSAPAVISSTTGSPTITTDGAATVYKFTGDGTLVVGTAGVARILVVGAGGAGLNDGGGGAGGFVTDPAYDLTAGTYTIKIGAPVASDIGKPSYLGSVLAMGGGNGRANTGNGVDGASGGGAGRSSTGGAAIYGSQGFAGGNASGASVGQGGGGAGAAGTNSVASGGTGLGGAGLQSDIVVKGTNVYYSGGGNGSGTTTPAGQAASATAGANNSGQGGGGFGATTLGGSGVVIVRVG